jgi:hypothetical protein
MAYKNAEIFKILFDNIISKLHNTFIYKNNIRETTGVLFGSELLTKPTQSIFV